MSRILLIDTNSVFFRAFYGLPPMTTSQGLATSAVYGFCTLLLKLLREQQPKGVAFARDAPAATFRHLAYSEYKAQRAPVPGALAVQFALLDRLLAALALPVFSAAGYEADDVLATLARELASHGERVRVVSGDRDLFQIASEAVDVLFLGRRGQQPIVYDVAAVERRYALPPERLPAWFALVGDDSDNLPGVPGIGARTASRLLAQQGGGIRELLDRLSDVVPERVREALRAAAPRVLQNEQLATLDAAVPLPDEPRHGLPSTEAIAALRALFVELEFKSLLGKL